MISLKMRYWWLIVAGVHAAVQLDENFAKVKNFTNINLQKDEVMYIPL